jgi:hypothetical protein
MASEKLHTLNPSPQLEHHNKPTKMQSEQLRLLATATKNLMQSSAEQHWTFCTIMHILKKHKEQMKIIWYTLL